jgi:hypothetical protein
MERAMRRRSALALVAVVLAAGIGAVIAFQGATTGATGVEVWSSGSGTAATFSRAAALAEVQGDPRLAPGDAVQAKLVSWAELQSRSGGLLRSHVVAKGDSVWAVEVTGGYRLSTDMNMKWMIFVYDQSGRMAAQMGSLNSPVPAFWVDLHDLSAP